MDTSTNVASFLGGMVVASGVHILTSRLRSKEPELVLESKQGKCDEEIKQELFSRVASFFGPDNFVDVENSFVVVCTLSLS